MKEVAEGESLPGSPVSISKEDLLEIEEIQEDAKEAAETFNGRVEKRYKAPVDAKKRQQLAKRISDHLRDEDTDEDGEDEDEGDAEEEDETMTQAQPYAPDVENIPPIQPSQETPAIKEPQIGTDQAQSGASETPTVIAPKKRRKSESHDGTTKEAENTGEQTFHLPTRRQAMQELIESVLNTTVKIKVGTAIVLNQDMTKALKHILDGASTEETEMPTVRLLRYGETQRRRKPKQTATVPALLQTDAGNNLVVAKERWWNGENRKTMRTLIDAIGVMPRAEISDDPRFEVAENNQKAEDDSDQDETDEEESVPDKKDAKGKKRKLVSALITRSPLSATLTKSNIIEIMELPSIYVSFGRNIEIPAWRALIDSGSQINVMSHQVWARCQLSLEPTSSMSVPFHGSARPFAGKTTCEVRLGDSYFLRQTFYVMPANTTTTDVLLGMPFIAATHMKFEYDDGDEKDTEIRAALVINGTRLITTVSPSALARRKEKDFLRKLERKASSTSL